MTDRIRKNRKNVSYPERDDNSTGTYDSYKEKIAVFNERNYFYLGQSETFMYKKNERHIVKRNVKHVVNSCKNCCPHVMNYV